MRVWGVLRVSPKVLEEEEFFSLIKFKPVSDTPMSTLAGSGSGPCHDTVMYKVRDPEPGYRVYFRQPPLGGVAYF